MKRPNTIILICGVIIAVLLFTSQSFNAVDARAFIQTTSIENHVEKKVSHLAITSFSYELFVKNLPYLNSK